MPSKPVIDCDRCVAPGTCCKAFSLPVEVPRGSTPAEVKAALTKRSFEPLPFVPLRRTTGREGYDPTSPTEYWLFGCPKLGADGRCTIYQSRPQTCQVYKPGSDPMCVHYVHDGKPLVPQLPRNRLARPKPVVRRRIPQGNLGQ